MQSREFIWDNTGTFQQTFLENLKIRNEDSLVLFSYFFEKNKEFCNVIISATPPVKHSKRITKSDQIIQLKDTEYAVKIQCQVWAEVPCLEEIL